MLIKNNYQWKKYEILRNLKFLALYPLDDLPWNDPKEL